MDNRQCWFAASFFLLIEINDLEIYGRWFPTVSKRYVAADFAMSILVAHNRWPGRPIQLLFSELFKRCIDKRLMSLILTKSIYFWKPYSVFRICNCLISVRRMQCPEVIFVFVIYYKFCWVRNTCLRVSQFFPHYTARTRLHKDCSRHIRVYPLKLYFHTNFYLYLAIWCLHFTIVLLNFVLLLALLSDYQAVQSTHIKFSLPHPFFLLITHHISLVHTHRGKSEN